MNTIKTLSALALAVSLPAHALSGESRPLQLKLGFQGTDHNWFNPANWSKGRVPGADDDVILDADDDVVIDPALGTPDVQVRDVRMSGNAKLTTLPGTHVRHRAFAIVDRSQVIYRSSAVEGETLIAAAPTECLSCNGLKLNPTPKVIRTVVLQSSVVQFGLGGRNPAAIQKIGRGTLILNGYGHYATLTSDVVVLGNAPAVAAIRGFLSRPVGFPAPANAPDLRISARIDKLPSAATARIDRLPRLTLALHYDFKPAVGDTFQIITAKTLVGQFADLPEGALVGCTEDDSVGVHITYRGGDGNDVVLTAKPGSPTECATREHILLARQVGV